MNRIRELRKQMDMTQKELAKHLQVSDSTLSYWEMGKYEPDNETLMRLSRFFQVPIDYILGGDFAQWDVSGSKMPYTDADTSLLSGSVISVSEPETEYCISDKEEDSTGLATIDSPPSASSESSIPDTTKPATPPNTTYGNRNAQATFDRIEFEGLTQGEVGLLAEYALFVKSRRKE